MESPLRPLSDARRLASSMCSRTVRSPKNPGRLRKITQTLTLNCVAPPAADFLTVESDGPLPNGYQAHYRLEQCGLSGRIVAKHGVNCVDF